MSVMAKLEPDTLLRREEKDTWVQCDRCSKWRRVPQSLASSLDEHSKWDCGDNPDLHFNNCDASQELSNDDIDRALANGTYEEDALQQTKPSRPVIWQHISENIFTHRSRKVENEDDIMVCQCRPPSDGGPGCGENCLNRMLNQECNPEYCPCGAQCTNTQFTKRQYADLEQRRAGPKGFGLFTKQALKAGHFVIEYIGEVLEEEEYLRRKMFYQEIGQRHYYFMNVGNGEVIDACRKGALGRFINHSCDPNCETQKWVVHGELAIGLFVLKDVEAGEELTFDYNFERYGDRALKCYCNAKTCRGYIGGTPEEHEIDTDMEENIDASNDPEPIMVEEEDASSNPALQAILANEVGLAAADYHDDRMRKGWDVLASTYGMKLDWESIGKGLAHTAELAGESRSLSNAGALSSASLEAVEQKLKESKAHGRLQSMGGPKGALAVPPKKRLVKESSSTTPASSTVAVTVDTALPSPASVQAARQQKWQSPIQKKFRRRSEVDRRLDTLVAPSGKLREPGTNSIVRMLRLFNLCDVGTATTSGRPAKAEHSEVSSKSAGGLTLSGGEAASAGTAPSNSTTRRSDQSTGVREDFAEHRSKKPRLDHGEASPRSRSPTKLASSSPGEDREDGEIGELTEQEPRHTAQSGRLQENGRSHHSGEPLQLTARQRARMADLSLLLDVILKTSSSSTKREFCKCGILRQLQSVLGRCTAEAYIVIVKKSLRAIDNLPLTAEDLHQHSSAHGSFADTLWALGGHHDHEIRSRARSLREKYPLEACSKEVQEAARAARAAAAARKARHMCGQPYSRRRNWSAGEPRESPYGGFLAERLTRPGSGKPRASKFHGPNETPAWETAPKDSYSWQPRDRAERENLWSYGPAAPTPVHVSHEEPGPRRPQPYPSPMPMSFSTPLPTTVAPQAHPGHWKGLHRLHSATTGTVSGQPSSAWHPVAHASGQQPPRHLPSPPGPPGFAPPFSHDHPPLPQPSGATVAQSPPPYSVPQDLASPSRRMPALQPPPRAAEGSPITPDGSPLPPLPKSPPPTSSPLRSPVSPGLPAGSPVTPCGQPRGSPVSPPMQSGAFMDDGPPSDDGRPAALSPNSTSPRLADHSRAEGRGSDWKVPAWDVSKPGGDTQRAGPNIALVAPLPAPGVLGSTANGSAHHPPSAEVPESDGVPSVDGDAGSPSPDDGTQSWDRPDAAFDEFVGRVIAHRLGKYKQPDHPNRIGREDFSQLYKKSRRAIIDAERKAYEERQRARTFKLIERHKLEARIKDYVRELIRRLHERKTTRL